MEIQKLVKSIQPYCYQIILFGSCATGANCAESDIDLFIKTDEKKLVQKVIARFNRSIPHLKTVMYDPLEILEAQKADKAFFNQVKKGITLWEDRPNHERL
ncbi:MAG: nucleotidyltransferase domain-containing protein [Candidatus Omnitrophota bacterium]